MCRCLLFVVSVIAAASGVCAAEMRWVDHSPCRVFIDHHQYAKAFTQCSEMAQAGDAPAMFNLSTMYARGWGVAKDEAKDLEWLRAAAERRYPPAEYALSSRYAAGAGVSKNIRESRRLLQDAAEQGLLIAQVMLGRFHEAGYAKLGIEKNGDVAANWYRQAVKQCEACNFELWRIYSAGKVVAKDEALATRHLMRAAEAGLPAAQQQLGFRYAEGQGVGKDMVQAYKWMLLARSAGDAAAPFARKALRLFRRKMSRSQVAQAEQMARKFAQGADYETQQICVIYDAFCKKGSR